MSEPEQDPAQQATPAMLAERAVLGAMLLSPSAIDDASQIISSRDYASPRHELIHDAITALHASGTPVDLVTVGDKLGPDLPRAGGMSYLAECTSRAPVPAAVSHYADIVRASQTIRTVDAVATRIHQAVTSHGDEGDVLDLVNAARDQLDALTAADSQGVIPNHQALYEAMEELEASPGSPTPWDTLTNAIAGWKPGCLYLIGARPGIGKSVAGVGVLLDTARRGSTGLMYSLEMSRVELYHRMLASVGTINMAKIQHRRLSPDDWARAAGAGKHIADLPLVVDDRTALSLAQIRAHIKSEQRKHHVGVVVIDYLQLIAPPPGTPRDDRRVQVDAISRGLKNLAKDCNVPVIALTQLNRGSEQRADKTPTLADLREAGGQEQDADVVLLLHRDIAGHKDDPSKLHLIVGKNRHGSSANLELTFRGEYSRIEEPAWSPSAHLERNAS